MAKKASITFGVIFILVGLLGFIGGLGIVGPNGIFVTNTLHDVVHVLLGIILLVAGYSTAKNAALWLKIVGVVYLVVALLGFFMGSPLLGIIDINGADNWLHLVLAVVVFLAGWYGSKDTMMAAAPAQQ